MIITGDSSPFFAVLALRSSVAALCVAPLAPRTAVVRHGADASGDEVHQDGTRHMAAKPLGNHHQPWLGKLLATIYGGLTWFNSL